MANISKVSVGGLNYDIKDTLAYEHIANLENPHDVTKAQVGLGNVSDLTPEQILARMTALQVNRALGYTPADTLVVENKLDAITDGEATALITFKNGIKVGGALISYDSQSNTVTFS